jgi:hypothetical protein
MADSVLRVTSERTTGVPHGRAPLTPENAEAIARAALKGFYAGNPAYSPGVSRTKTPTPGSLRAYVTGRPPSGAGATDRYQPAPRCSRQAFAAYVAEWLPSHMIELRTREHDDRGAPAAG